MFDVIFLKRKILTIIKTIGKEYRFLCLKNWLIHRFLLRLTKYVNWSVSFFILTLIYNLKHNMSKEQHLLIPVTCSHCHCLFDRRYKVGGAGLSYMVVKFSLVGQMNV